MKDEDLRAALLKELYEKRSQDWVQIGMNTFNSPEDKERIRIAQQLAEYGLIEFKMLNRHVGGMARIRAKGIDVIESAAKEEKHLYQHSFDNTYVGNWRLSRKKFEQVHECIKLLLTRVEEWNRVAVTHGAQEGPYLDDAAALKDTIEWGEEQLQDKNRTEVLVKGISVGSLRYAKAALLYGARVREAEAQAQEKRDWPNSVKDALRNIAKPLRDLAETINYPPADILSEIAPSGITVTSAPAPEWHAFISHASEDKQEFVEQLAQELRSRGLKIWYDNFTLKVGDSLRRSIDRGLAHSRYGIVVLSQNFFAKEWPQKELDGLVAREVDGHKVILPVWLKIDAAAIRAFSPILADRVAVSSSLGVQKAADALVDGMDLTVK